MKTSIKENTKRQLVSQSVAPNWWIKISTSFLYCTISDGISKMFCETLVGNHWSVGRFVLSCLVQEVILSQCMNYCEQHFGISFSVYVTMVHVTYKYQYFKYNK
jgi:hypothetical protein